ncbi:MAG: TerB family tellurite resistance protein [Anaerolineales bacterium]|jgi:uncharacterized tellurite resistance protein B-like protein
MRSRKIPNKQMIMTLAKVIIAAAWADGKMTFEEINCLKDLLFHLHGLDARDWASLDMYIENPVETEERERLLYELKNLIRTEDEKQLAREALDQMLHADGVVTEHEQAVAKEIEEAIESTTTGVFGGVGKLISGAMERRSKVLARAPNRERDIDEFLRNKVLYRLRQRIQQGDLALDIPEDDLRKLSLAGGLMARVAHVDRHTSEGEIEAMVDAICQGWNLTPDAAAFVAEVAVSGVSAEVDNFRLTREFFTCTTPKERLQLIHVLFAVAAADGDLTFAETEEIRTIAIGFKLTHKQFINAKLKVLKS